MRIPLLAHRRDRPRTRGQSLVEFALVLPVLLLLMLIAIDFGRVFLGWVNVQQMTRIAANYAADHASAWGTPGNVAERDRYQTRVRNDARAINCDLPATLPPPQISGSALGAHVRVAIDCEFHVITPIISNLIGGTILVSAETTYPIKEGVVATVPGGGSPIGIAPTADFVGSPQSGWGTPASGPAPLEVTFTDLSTGGPAAWTWDFSAGAPSGTGTPSLSMSTSTAEGPHTVRYGCEGSPGDTCIYNVSLSVSNASGADSAVRADYITVTVPPDTGPIAEFTGTPRSGTKPLTVSFQFVDLRSSAVTYTLYEWDLNGDGSPDATGPTAAFNYTTEGSYDVTLRVVDDTGAENSLTKVGYINVIRRICTVPDFANVRRNNAQSAWSTAGFTTQVQFLGGNGNYVIQTQSLVGGTIDPQPDGCDSVISVGP
jgi:PKD repeat protein